LGTLVVLALGVACDARTSVEGAQTAVAVAQTALPGLQTALPGVQATAQAGATLITGVLSDPVAINAQLQVLLAGATVDLKTTPSGVANDAITQIEITATDTRGTFEQLDARARQAAGGAAMLLAAQYYPNATVALSVVDSSGGALLSGTKALGQTPSLQ
jgi:hypothetical protein